VDSAIFYDESVSRILAQGMARDFRNPAGQILPVEYGLPFGGRGRRPRQQAYTKERSDLSQWPGRSCSEHALLLLVAVVPIHRSAKLIARKGGENNAPH